MKNYFTKTTRALPCILAIALCSSVTAKDYYVSLTGSNSNSGTSLDQPFLTMQHAVNRMEPGDICYIRGGSYPQSINLAGITGNADAPITLTAYNGEEVILDGTRAITSNWTLDEGNVYKTTLNNDITQLFVDGKIMTLARYPNAPVFSDQCWSYDERLQRDGPNNNGIALDEALTEVDFPLNDCVAVVNFHTHRTRARLVKDHVPGSDTFNYNNLPNTKGGRGYFFEGGLNNAERVLLDTAEEWAYDESTKTLYLWPDDGQNPNGRAIQGKRVIYSVTGNANTQNIVLDGLNFLSSSFHFVSSDGITIQNCNFDYYVNSRRALGDIEAPRTAFFEGSDADNCTDITVYNCEFKHADGCALWGLYTDNMVIENNLFKEIDYACVNPSDDFQTTHELHFMSQSTLSSYEGKDTVYRRNTIDTAGSAQGVFFVAYGFVNPWVCEFNFHTRCALMETDTSSVYSPLGDVVESVARNNWFIANRGRDFRWDGANNGPVAQGRDANYYRNVSKPESVTTNKGISGAGARLKGDFHEIYNNTSVYGGAQLNVAEDKGGNDETITYNNAADVLTADPIPGTASHNFDSEDAEVSLVDLLRDPENWDFRPRADASLLIDQGRETTCEINDEIVDVTAGFNGAAPDIGAYEFGDSYYWIAGRQESQASMPIPRSGGPYARIDTDLMYLIGLDGVSANVYFGESPNALSFLTNKVAAENIVNPSDFVTVESNETYYWRVDTVLADGTVVPGEVWSFNTEVILELPELLNRSVSGGAFWERNESDDQLIYNNNGTTFTRRAIAYSGEEYQSDEGFELTIGYTTGTINGSAGHNFSFGLISTDTNLANYTGENPFQAQQNVYSLGVHLVGDNRGLRYTNGTATTILDVSGDNVQFGENDSETNIVSIKISPGGVWQYSINGTTEATGTIPEGFDLSKSYRIAIFGQDDHGGGKAIQHVSIKSNEAASSGPVSEWKFDEGIGSTVADSISGDYPATRAEGHWIVGPFGNAMYFNGNTDGVILPANAFSGVSDSNEVTVSMWINGDNSQPTRDTVLQALDADGNRVLNIHLPWTGGTVFWDAGNEGALYDRVSKVAQPSDYSGGWNHWVFTKDSNTGEMQIFLNGNLWLDETGFTRELNEIASVTLGNGVDGTSSYNGAIDEVRLYSTALSATDVAALYSSYSPLEDRFTPWVNNNGGSFDLTGDSDNDGVSNLLEYVLNGDPTNADYDIQPNIVFSNSAIEYVFRFTRRAESVVDTNQTFLYSTDLKTWNSINLTGDIGPEVAIGNILGDTQRLDVKLETTGLGEGGKVFGRLEVTPK